MYALSIKYDLLVSIGDEIDKGILVWDLKTFSIVSANLNKSTVLKGV